MKKLLSIILIMVTLLGTCMLGGCGVCGEPCYGLYTLESAYKEEILTLEDLLSIAYYHNGGREGNEGLMPEDYYPVSKNQEELSNKTEEMIKQQYIIQMSLAISTEMDNYEIAEYYGTYNGKPVVMLKYYGENNTFDDWNETINGVNFNYTENCEIFVWEVKHKR